MFDLVDTTKDSFIVIVRIVTMLPLLLLVTIFMGKRSVGQLPIFDFLIIITLASVVGADIADPAVNHVPTGVAIITLGVLQKVVSKWKNKSRKVGRLITFEPTVVISDGKFLKKNLNRIGYSIDNILQMLRGKMCST